MLPSALTRRHSTGPLAGALHPREACVGTSAARSPLACSTEFARGTSRTAAIVFLTAVQVRALCDRLILLLRMRSALFASFAMTTVRSVQRSILLLLLTDDELPLHAIPSSLLTALELFLFSSTPPLHAFCPRIVLPHLTRRSHQLPIETVAAVSLIEHAVVAGVRLWAASLAGSADERLSTAANVAATAEIIFECFLQWFVSLVIASLFQVRKEGATRSPVATRDSQQVAVAARCSATASV